MDIQKVEIIHSLENINTLIQTQINQSKRQRQQVLFLTRIVITVIAIYLLLTFVFGISVLNGNSMNPTLSNGDVSLYFRLDRDYKSGDIVLFRSFSTQEILVKRIVAGPGDTITIVDGKVFVNNSILKEPYIFSQTPDRGEVDYPLTLGKDEFFVLGDNRDTSMDSRSAEIGVVNKKYIKGKIIATFRFGNH